MSSYRRESQTSWYDVMQACLNGHVINSKCRENPSDMKKRCSECGAETITQCPSCKADIQGYEHIPSLYYPGPDSPPAYCHECGEAYPWTKSKPSNEANARKPHEVTTKIFIVHGHDEEMKQSVARALSKLGLEPIILHEQPNRGKTVIEKFEQNADVGFAVALLSPDDMAHVAKADPASSKLRARQNVVLELGYFVGRLGRDRVLALKRGDVEVPSDFNGVVYTDYDVAGHWRFEMVKELKAAGYNVDANALI